MSSFVFNNLFLIIFSSVFFIGSIFWKSSIQIFTHLLLIRKNKTLTRTPWCFFYVCKLGTWESKVSYMHIDLLVKTMLSLRKDELEKHYLTWRNCRNVSSMLTYTPTHVDYEKAFVIHRQFCLCIFLGKTGSVHMTRELLCNQISIENKTWILRKHDPKILKSSTE